MPFQLLEAHINKHLNITKEEFEVYKRHFTPLKIAKKDFLLEQGEICKVEAFVTKGSFRLYTTDANGKEHVLYFAVKDWWMADIDSFTNSIPSSITIQAMENSEVLMITRKQKDLLYKELPIVEKQFRIMSQKGYVALQRRLIQSHSMTAQDRYLNFTTKYPQIAQKLTNIQLASYLGISHEFLSKIRNKITQLNR